MDDGRDNNASPYGRTPQITVHLLAHRRLEVEVGLPLSVGLGHQRHLQLHHHMCTAAAAIPPLTTVDFSRRM